MFKGAINAVPVMHNQETEQLLLALALRNPSLIALNKDTDFYISDNALIWRSLEVLSGKGASIDPATMNNHIVKETGKDLFEYLADIYNMEVPVEHADTYSNIIKEHAYSRFAVETADKIKKVSQSALNSIDKSAAINTYMEELEASAVVDYEPISIGEALQNQATNLENIAEGSALRIMTGFHEVDSITGGLMGGDLIIVAGRPGMGKTAFALNIAENVAKSEWGIDNEIVIPFFSLEMSSNQLAGRYACSIAEIDTKKMRSGDLTEAEWARYADAMAIAATQGIMIDERAALSMEEIRQVCLRYKRRGKKLGPVFIDYIQIIKRTKDTGFESISEISGQLKGLAKELDVPVIALSQLSRDVEKRADKRPLPSDLRESGAIEQDADIIMFTYRDEVYHADTPMPGKAEIIVPKNRGGEPGMALLDFQGKFSRFTDERYEAEDDDWVAKQ